MAPASPQRAAAPVQQRAPVPAAAPPSAVAPSAAAPGGGKDSPIQSCGLLITFFFLNFRNDGEHCFNSGWSCHWIGCRTRNHRNVQRWLFRCSPPRSGSRSPGSSSSDLIFGSISIGPLRMGNQAVPSVRSAAVRLVALRRIQ